MRIPALLLFFLLSTIAQANDPYALVARNLTNPEFKYHPSPADWRDVSMYQIITDRWYDGNPDNNDDNPYARKIDATANDGIHGGDFVGLHKKLDYLEQLGVNGLWISPLPENTVGDYHGYATQDNKRVDPHWGTAKELNDLIDEMHARGMVVILDIVLNHMGPVAYSVDPGWATFKYPETYSLKWVYPDRIPPAPFNDLDMYHGHGAIHEWEDPLQKVYGNFFSLNDLKTTSPKVRKALIEVFCNLIAATDCDGFRIDTVKHTEMDLWNEFNAAIQAYAKSIGKENFLIFGEYLDYRDSHVGDCTHRGFNSMLHFPIQGATHELFVDNREVRVLHDRIRDLRYYHPEARNQLVNFLDNHDHIPRLAHRIKEDPVRVKASLDFLYTWPGIPLLYYGTEQGFDGGHDPRNREDMFDGEYEWGPSLGDNFDPKHPLFQHVAGLHRLRGDFPALRHGDLTLLTPPSTRGALVFSRATDHEEILIALHWDPTATHRLNVRRPEWNNGDIWEPIDGARQALTVEQGQLVLELHEPQRMIFRKRM